MAANCRLPLLDVTLVLFTAIGTGCNRSNVGGPSQSATAPTSGAESDHVGNKDSADPSIRVSESEAREFAERWSAALHRGDVDAASAMFDWDEVLRRAAAGIEVNERALANFNRGVRESAGNRLFQNVADVIEQGGNYDLLRIHMGRGGRRVLFRLTGSDGSLNYLDLVLYRAEDGDVKVADIDTTSLGEHFSETLRRGVLQMAAHENRSVLQRMTGWQADYIKYLPKVEQMPKLLQEGRFQEVLDIYGQLPPSLQREKTMLILRVGAAMQVGEAEYVAAVDDLAKHHPDAPCVGLYMIEASRQKGDLDGAVEAVNRLDKVIGGDPYLNLTRASLFVEKRDYTKARQLLEKVEQWNPKQVETQWVHISIALAQRDFDEVVRRLRIITDDLNSEVADLTTVPEYAEFVKSAQYDAWVKSKQPNP